LLSDRDAVASLNVSFCIGQKKKTEEKKRKEETKALTRAEKNRRQARRGNQAGQRHPLSNAGLLRAKFRSVDRVRLARQRLTQLNTLAQPLLHDNSIHIVLLLFIWPAVTTGTFNKSDLPTPILLD